MTNDQLKRLITERIVPEKTNAKLMTQILSNMFPDETWDDSVERTAQRIIAFYQEYVPPKAMPFIFTTFKGVKGQLLARKTRVKALCPHHLLPYFGNCWVGYIINKKQAGLSKLSRLVKWLAKRPVTQEELTANIVKYLEDILEPLGVFVVIKATHTCIICRGVGDDEDATITSLPKGVFFSSASARDEFLELIKL